MTYVVPQEFHPQLDGHGFRCVHAGFDLGPALLDGYGKYAVGLGGARMIRLFVGRFVGPHLDDFYNALDAEVASADVVLSQNLASVVASMVCERRSVPMVLGDLFPMQVPTAFAPPVGMPSLGRPVNRIAWRAGQYVAANHMPGTRGIRAYRRRLGLQSNGWSLMDVTRTARLSLGLVSPGSVDHLPDWPSQYRLVGFTPWSGTTDAGLPDDVSAFLDAGDPPILITQGTAAASARTDCFARAAEAVDRAGGRALLLTSNERIAQELLSRPGARHAIWPFVPLTPLLPHCRGVIHAGGLGTTALTLTAGLPSAISPGFIDTIWHAQRHEEVGLGVRIRRHNLDRAVERLVTDEDLLGRARSFGEQIAGEDGPGTACDEIETLLRTG